MATDWIELEKEKAERDAIRETIKRTYNKCWTCVHCGKYNKCLYYNKIVGHDKLLDTDGCPHYRNKTKIDNLKWIYESDFAHNCLIVAGIGIIILVVMANFCN